MKGESRRSAAAKTATTFWKAARAEPPDSTRRGFTSSMYQSQNSPQKKSYTRREASSKR
jgi:hypothetical protein